MSRRSDVVDAIQTSTGRVELRADGIVYLNADRGSMHTLEDALAGVAAVAKLAGTTRVPIIAELRWVGGIARDARQAYAAGCDRHALAMALIVESSFSRMLAGVFVRVSRPAVPMKVFRAESEAVAWLDGMVTSDESSACEPPP